MAELNADALQWLTVAASVRASSEKRHTIGPDPGNMIGHLGLHRRRASHGIECAGKLRRHAATLFTT